MDYKLKKYVPYTIYTLYNATMKNAQTAQFNVIPY